VSNKIYVGNLPFSSTQEDLEALFGRHGTVASVNVITDRETGRPRGFAFVEMESASDADDGSLLADEPEPSDRGGAPPPRSAAPHSERREEREHPSEKRISTSSARTPPQG
jgi:hypothetical protein